MRYAGPYLDPGQYGGLKGFSVNHYLIKLLHFIQSELDQRIPHAVICTLVDLSKAFNRVDHNLIMQDLYDMKCPSWLLKIVFSYLDKRSLIVSYDRATSEAKALKAGAPAGTVLGVFIFIVKINGFLLRPSISKEIIPVLKENKSLNVKYMDDATTACSINLKKSLIRDPVIRPQPLNFFEKDQLVLDEQCNPMKTLLEDMLNFTNCQNMKINQEKTKLMVFNPSRKSQFPPEMGFPDQENLEYVRKFKILGLIITDSLKWSENTQYIIDKCMKRLWILRRMKNIGLENNVILDVYIKEIRSVLEFCVPVWNGALTVENSTQIESIQKKVLKIILGGEYRSYEYACKIFNIQSLEVRRDNLCLKFAKKEYFKETSLFNKFTSQKQTRLSERVIVKEYNCNTDRFFRSSLPYLSRMLNISKNNT